MAPPVPDEGCRAKSGGRPVKLITETVARGIVLLERDEYDELHAVKVIATIARARCDQCRRRWRVLPYDVLPHKRYSTPVIEHLASAYAPGQRGLRPVAWSLLVVPPPGSPLEERTPAHTTLHGWTEGLGAHALDRPGSDADGAPVSRFITEAAARDHRIDDGWQTRAEVDPRRYRSEDRRERLAAMAVLLLVAAMAAAVASPHSLSECRRLVLEWSNSYALAFPSRFPCPSIEHRCSTPRERSRPLQGRRLDRCRKQPEIHGTSPPGASS
jgi:hypothetical protein